VSGTPQSLERVLAKGRVLPHAAAQPRLGQLQDHGGDAADVEAEWILEDLPGHRIGWQQRGFAARLKEIVVDASITTQEICETRSDLVVKPPREHELELRGIHVLGRNRLPQRVLVGGYLRGPYTSLTGASAVMLGDNPNSKPPATLS
jgi:hypothetical protein